MSRSPTVTTSTSTAAPTTTAEAPTTTVPPTTTSPPTTTVPPTTTSPPTTTVPPTTTTSAPVRLAWPDDVGTSRFGVLGRSFAIAGGWIRPHPGVFLWSDIERSQGTYNWMRVDWDVMGWQADRLAVLATVWPFNSWDQQSCHGDDPEIQPVLWELPRRLFAPCDKAAYRDWLTALVERYDGDGVDDMPGLAYPIRHWEIANEPAMQGGHGYFFQGTSADYLELLATSASIIRTADPEALVLTGGQAGMQPEFTDFWRPVLLEAGGSFDIGNIHSIGSDASFFSAPYRAFLDSTGHADIPYWVTEALLPTMPAPGQRAPTPDQLARDTFTGFASALADGADRIFNVGPHDPTGGPGPESDAAFELLARSIGGFSSASRLSPSSTRFNLPDGTVTYLLWNGSGLPADVTGEVMTTGYNGTTATADASTFRADVPTLVSVSP